MKKLAILVVGCALAVGAVACSKKKEPVEPAPATEPATTEPAPAEGTPGEGTPPADPGKAPDAPK